jgi:hypothetical protein
MATEDADINNYEPILVMIANLLKCFVICKQKNKKINKI